MPQTHIGSTQRDTPTLASLRRRPEITGKVIPPTAITREGRMPSAASGLCDRTVE